jgi:hypothetical protein
MPELAREFRIFKTTGTHADVLAAVGLADVLAEALGSDEAVTIVDEGPAFLLRLGEAVSDEDVLKLPAGAGYPFLKTKEDPPGECKDVVDYSVEKQRVDQWRRQKQDLRKAGKQDSEIDQALKDLAPREDWRHWQVLNTLQGDGATNSIALLARRDEFRDQAAKALRALASGGKTSAPWGVSIVQVFTPTAGKGYCRLKPDSTSRSALPDAWCDPLLEWCRHRGYFRVAAPQFMGDDIRIFVPIPGDIAFSHLRVVSRRLISEYIPGDVRPKRDALATLTLATLLIEHSEFRQGSLPLRGRRLSQVIAGLTVAHYQSLGQARALSETGMLAVPGWFEIQGRGDADALLESLAEHRRVVVGLRDDHSDEIGLLHTYRRFLETRGEAAIEALLDFAATYGSLVLRVRGQDRKRRIAQFGIGNLERLIMATVPKYAPILQDAGLRAVADAVRNSTVLAQYWKSKQQEHREIRYDLLPELRRKRMLPGGTFIEAASDFVASYNAENARRREMGKPAPASITDAQLAALAALVDDHGAALVGALLCALGTCREDKGGGE